MVSLYSLQNLYNQGILDYVPAELASAPNVSSLAGMQNPYLNMAMQGNLYQSAGMAPDSFSYTNAGINAITQDGTAGHANAGYVGGNAGGGYYTAGLNGFGGINGNYGFNNPQAGMNGFGGVNGNVGFNNPQAGINGLGGVNGNVLTNNSQAGINGFGGGFGKLGQAISNTPNSIKGLLAAGLIIGTAALCLKRGKKPPVKQPQTSNFFSKLKFWEK